jgi:hypothetical protein
MTARLKTARPNQAAASKRQPALNSHCVQRTGDRIRQLGERTLRSQRVCDPEGRSSAAPSTASAGAHQARVQGSQTGRRAGFAV